MVFADYYSCTDTREATKSLGVFLQEAIAALELVSGFSPAAVDGATSPARLASRLKARLLESSEKLNYHLDGDQPMVLYRFWMRFVSFLFFCRQHPASIAPRGRAVARVDGLLCFPSIFSFWFCDVNVQSCRPLSPPVRKACV